MRVRYSVRANADLEKIGLWIAADNPPRAETYVQELRAECDALGDGAERYAFVSDKGTLRKKLFWPHLIPHRVRRGEVIIVSIRYGRRDNRGLR